MQFENKTPFPALAYVTVDQDAQAFDVIVLRQTLRWNEAGVLRFADEQAPLTDCNQPFDDGPDAVHRDLRQESDLCPYKPRCDVLVNATAHAPRGQPSSTWPVRLVLRRPSTPAPLPPKPQGLNPFMAPDPEAMAQWQRDTARAQASSVPGAVLIDKPLRVLGPRAIKGEFAVLRVAGDLLKVASLGLMPSPDWRLTESEATMQVPVRLSHAFGGGALVTLDPNDPASQKTAARVPKTQQLSPAYKAQLPATPGAPSAVAHEALSTNPDGRGFLRAWHWNATRTRELPAPQVEHPKRPLKPSLLQRMAKASAKTLDAKLQAELSALVAGYGVRPAIHPERSVLAGTADQAFIDSGQALPNDFDFAFWNAAWPDQQVDDLHGDEVIELTNLCAASAPGAVQDAAGNTLLRLQLPRHTVQVLVRLLSGEMFMHRLRIDTLLIEPETQTLSMVWRTLLAQDPEVPVRLVEAFALDAQRTRELQEDIQRYRDLFAKLPLPAQTQPATQTQAKEALHD
jgi:hypothetical protein